MDIRTRASLLSYLWMLILGPGITVFGYLLGWKYVEWLGGFICLSYLLNELNPKFYNTNIKQYVIKAVVLAFVIAGIVYGPGWFTGGVRGLVIGTGLIFLFNTIYSCTDAGKPFSAYPQASGKISAQELEDVLQQLQPYRRDVWIPETKSGDGGLRESKFGGTPWLAVDEGYPLCEICAKPMALYVQINVQELEGSVPNLPAQGLMQFFHCVSEEECDGADGWEAFPQQQMKLVRIVQSDEYEHDLPVPQFDYPVKPRHVVDWKKQQEYPMPHEDVFEKNIKLTDEQLYACAEGKAGKTVLNYQKDKVAGWPGWVQYPEYPSCPECEHEMKYFMQIESEDNLDRMWGDAGVAYLYVCEQHKDVMAMLWQCH